MTIKKFDERFDIALWILALLFGGLSWWCAYSITAPQYEKADSNERFPYEYTASDGDKIESYYELAWDHSGYSPKLVVHDFRNDRTNGLKDEYLAEYLETIPASAYKGWWYHIFWVWLSAFVLIELLFVFVVGQRVRDLFLYRKLIKKPTFTDCSYFLFHDRYAHKEDVENLLPQTAPAYIIAKRAELEKKYSPKLVSLVISTLNTISHQHSTEVKYFYTLRNELKQQNTYLDNLQEYWRTKRGVSPNAQEMIDLMEKLKKARYENFPDFGTEEEYHATMTGQLNKLFTELMGSEVFKFCAYESTYAAAMRKEGMLFVDTVLNNSTKYFTWGSSTSPYYAGISVYFCIYVFEHGQKTILWDGYLPAECNYRATDNEFSVKALYKNMIHTTIDTLYSKI